MIFNFILSYLNVIVLALWILFLLVVAIRYFHPKWVKNISYTNLIIIAFGLNIFYGLFLTFSQYYVWSIASDFTRSLLNSPLSDTIPFSNLLGWVHSFLLNSNHGYFYFYAWGRFWINILILFILSGGLYSIFRLFKYYRGGFGHSGPELLFLLMLISGYPGILVFIPLGFIFAILLVIYSIIRKHKDSIIEPAFIISALFSLLFTHTILNFVLALF